MDIELMLEAIEAERIEDARRVWESNRARAALRDGEARPGRRGALSGVTHALAHRLTVGHARVAHTHGGVRMTRDATEA